MATSTYERDELLVAPGASHRLSLAGMFIGAFCALGLGLLFLSFGAALGVLRFNSLQGMANAGAGPAVWILVSVFVATYLGAAAGVRSSGLNYRRDAGIQGLITWALSFFLGMLFLGMIVSGLAAAVANPEVAQGAAQGAQVAAPSGAAASWWFFITAIAGLLGGVFGGFSGLTERRGEEPIGHRRHAGTLREREV